jgi:hypothetical protein
VNTFQPVQLRGRREGAGPEPGGQPEPGGNRPRGGLQDGHLVLDDAVITGRWTPSAADRAAGRSPAGYGVITNIINGRVECGMGPKNSGADRIGFYKRYCDMLGVGYGSNLDCYRQRKFG